MWEGFYAGIAGAHLLSGSYDESDYQNSYFPRNYNVILGNKIKLNDTYFVEASAMARVIEKYDNHLDLNAKFYYRPKIHRNDANYWTGVSYRLSWKEIPISSVSIAGFIGGSYNNFYYGYSYEAMIAKLQFHHTGSHQFMLGYTISMKGDRHCGCTPFSIPTL
jgi:type IX secretion system PorP/SprF family membrane protein